MTESEFRTNLMNEIESRINGVKNVDEYKLQLKEMLRNNSSSENDFVKLKNECETQINQIQSELIKIEKRFNARLSACKFEEFLGEKEKFVGELNLNSFQNEEAAQEEFNKGNLVLNSHIKYFFLLTSFYKDNLISIYGFFEDLRILTFAYSANSFEKEILKRL